MAFITEPLIRVVKFAYVVGVLLLLGGSCLAALTFPVQFEGSDVRTGLYGFLGMLMVAVLPGAALLILAYRLDRGSVWAFYVMSAIAVLQLPLVGLFVMMTMKPRAAIIAFPYFALGASCFIAWPHARRLSRQRRTYHAPSSTPTPPTPIVPPPPAISARRHR